MPSPETTTEAVAPGRVEWVPESTHDVSDVTGEPAEPGEADRTTKTGLLLTYPAAFGAGVVEVTVTDGFVELLTTVTELLNTLAAVHEAWTAVTR